MHFAAVVSFAAGLLLGGCIVVFGLRGSLFQRDTLLRQSSHERPATLSAPPARPLPTPATRPSRAPSASRGSHPPPPPIPSPSPIRQDPSGLRSCTKRSCLGLSQVGLARVIRGRELFSIFNFRKYTSMDFTIYIYATFLLGIESYPFPVAIGEIYL